MQADQQSAAPPRTYTNNWGDDIKVEIPETGVSLGEAYRFLRGWLGHETHISGEVYAHRQRHRHHRPRRRRQRRHLHRHRKPIWTPWSRQAAEHIYRLTQPYRYGVYLDRPGPHAGKRVAIFQALATGRRPRTERAWAYIGLGVIRRID